MENPVGYRFHPTDQELIIHYLKNMILGKVWLVDEAIGEVNICKFDPWDLRSKSKIRSIDPVWYFFSPRDSKLTNSKRTSRTTPSGYWKATGVDRKIGVKGGYRGEIGIKKTLVFYLGRVPKGQRTPWVMHEYHATFLPPLQRTYVLCKVKYKGEDMDVTSVNASEPSHSLASDLNNFGAMNTAASEVDQPIQDTPGSFYGLSELDLTMPLNEQAGLYLSEVQSPNELSTVNLQQQTPDWTQNDDEFLKGLKYVDPELVKPLFADEEQVPRISMQENCNDYRPQKSLTGVYVDYSSDSDAESISATSYQETSSPVDSVGSPNGHYQTRMDALRVEEILSFVTDDHKRSPTTGESSISTKARKSQYLPKTMNGEAQKRPTCFQLQGKQHHMRSPKEEIREDTEPFRAAGPSTSKKSCAQAIEREQEMAQGANKDTSVIKTEKKGWFILEDTIKKSCKNPPYIYLMNMIIGFILFVVLIGEILVVMKR